MEAGAITSELNPAQAAAVAAVRGPVAILAGAGSGKTTTITRRIAHQVASGTFTADQILAVTFTNRAAGELVHRLGALGVTGVNARTFHSAALEQLRRMAPDEPPRILNSKGALLYKITRSLAKPYRFTPTADVAQEIEWAKNQRISAAEYLNRLGDHEPPIPADLMARVYARYEDAKTQAGSMDFEDMLELTVRMFEDDDYIGELFRSRYKAFTVDEYQDVNLLQQTLLELWLGGTDDLCVVGDDYQSIYSFTAASARFLLDMPGRYPRCQVFRLERNYRSSPEILEVANRLVPKLGGAEKVLTPVADPGEPPTQKGFATPEAERAYLVDRIKQLHGTRGIAYESMAILYRINAASEGFEAALSGAGIAYQVRSGSFLARPAARSVLPALKRSRSKVDVTAVMNAAATKAGYRPEGVDDGGTEELTRQRDFARLIALAAEFEDGSRTVGELIEDLGTRFGADSDGRGVNLLTLHRAKGLEWDAVFLPSLLDGELPFKRALDTGLAEERRLFYVGMTRARRFLHLTWSHGGRRPVSRFMKEISPGVASTVAASSEATAPTDAPSEVVTALKRWRLERSRNDGVPAYVVMHDKTLEEIARRGPRNESDLLDVPGMGPTKCERYGDSILEVVAASR